jgi:beta-glucosidase
MDNLKTAAPSVKSGSTLEVSVELQNTSPIAGDQVVQLYTHQRSGSASRPERELKGFRRVTLKPGEKQIVTLALDTHDLGFWSSQTHQWSIESGPFDLWVGTDSSATQHATFTVLP